MYTPKGGFTKKVIVVDCGVKLNQLRYPHLLMIIIILITDADVYCDAEYKLKSCLGITTSTRMNGTVCL